MTPERNLARATALVWLREMAENPMSVEEIEELERNNLNEKGDPLIAVSLEPNARRRGGHGRIRIWTTG